MPSKVDSNGDGGVSLEEFGVTSSAFRPPSCDAGGDLSLNCVGVDVEPEFMFYRNPSAGCFVYSYMWVVFLMPQRSVSVAQEFADKLFVEMSQRVDTPELMKHRRAEVIEVRTLL